MTALRIDPARRSVRTDAPRHALALTVGFSILGLLSACQSSPALSDAISSPSKEIHAMSTPATADANTPKAQLSAKQAMERFLELIRGSASVEDFTADRMSQVMGVTMQVAGPGHYGYGQPLPGNWAVGIERQDVAAIGPRVSFSVQPIPGKDVEASAACDPNFAQFTQTLEQNGFSREAIRGEHNRHLYDAFTRTGLRVEVYPRKALANPNAPIVDACVDMVLVR